MVHGEFDSSGLRYRFGPWKRGGRPADIGLSRSDVRLPAAASTIVTTNLSAGHSPASLVQLEATAAPQGVMRSLRGKEVNQGRPSVFRTLGLLFFDHQRPRGISRRPRVLVETNHRCISRLADAEGWLLPSPFGHRNPFDDRLLGCHSQHSNERRQAVREDAPVGSLPRSAAAERDEKHCLRHASRLQRRRASGNRPPTGRTLAFSPGLGNRNTTECDRS